MRGKGVERGGVQLISIGRNRRKEVYTFSLLSTGTGMGAAGVDALLTGAGSVVASRCATSSMGGNTLEELDKVDDCVVDGKDAGAEAKERGDWTCRSGVATF